MTGDGVRVISHLGALPCAQFFEPAEQNYGQRRAAVGASRGVLRSADRRFWGLRGRGALARALPHARSGRFVDGSRGAGISPQDSSRRLARVSRTVPDGSRFRRLAWPKLGDGDAGYGPAGPPRRRVADRSQALLASVTNQAPFHCETSGKSPHSSSIPLRRVHDVKDVRASRQTILFEALASEHPNRETLARRRSNSVLSVVQDTIGSVCWKCVAVRSKRVWGGEESCVCFVISFSGTTRARGRAAISAWPPSLPPPVHQSFDSAFVYLLRWRCGSGIAS